LEKTTKQIWGRRDYSSAKDAQIKCWFARDVPAGSQGTPGIEN